MNQNVFWGEGMLNNFLPKKNFYFPKKILNSGFSTNVLNHSLAKKLNIRMCQFFYFLAGTCSMIKLKFEI